MLEQAVKHGQGDFYRHGERRLPRQAQGCPGKYTLVDTRWGQLGRSEGQLRGEGSTLEGVGFFPQWAFPPEGMRSSPRPRGKIDRRAGTGKGSQKFRAFFSWECPG